MHRTSQAGQPLDPSQLAAPGVVVLEAWRRHPLAHGVYVGSSRKYPLMPHLTAQA